MPPIADQNAISLALRYALSAGLLDTVMLQYAYASDDLSDEDRLFGRGSGGAGGRMGQAFRRKQIEEAVAGLLGDMGYREPQIEENAFGYKWDTPGFPETVNTLATNIAMSPTPNNAYQLGIDELNTLKQSGLAPPVPTEAERESFANDPAAFAAWKFANDPTYRSVIGTSEIDTIIQSASDPAAAYLDMLSKIDAINPELAAQFIASTPYQSQFDIEIQTRLLDNERARDWYNYINAQAETQASITVAGLNAGGQVDAAKAYAGGQSDAARWAAQGGLINADGEFLSELADFRQGGNYINASDGLLTAQGRVNPDVLFHNLAGEQLRSSGGFFDPDAHQFDSALANVNNPYAFAMWRMAGLPVIDERWTDPRYFQNYDPKTNASAGFVPTWMLPQNTEPEPTFESDPELDTQPVTPYWEEGLFDEEFWKYGQGSDSGPLVVRPPNPTLATATAPSALTDEWNAAMSGAPTSFTGIDPTPTPPDNLGPGFMTTPLGESGQQPRADLQNWRKKHNIRFGQSPLG